MNKRNVETIRNATAKALAAQVQRTLDVARIKGWGFPTNCDVAVTLLATTPLITQVMARMDDVVIPQANITPAQAAADIAKIADTLVAEWLAKHATTRPKRAR